LDLLPFVGIAAIMYLMLVRPAKKRQQEQARMVSQLAPGVKVMTTSGLLGTVAEVGDEIGLEVAPGVIVRFVPPAIARVIPAGPADPLAPADLGTAALADTEALAPGDDPALALGADPIADAQSVTGGEYRPQS
jgi:preprotein translocase subunit YajC